MSLTMTASEAGAGTPTRQDCELPLTPAAWHGSNAAAAPSTLRWDFGAATGIQCRDVPHDWSGYNALRFTVRANKASDSQVYVIVNSENDQTEGPDYFAATLPIDFAGERTVELPFDEFGKTRSPIGWNKIDSLVFNHNWGKRVKADPSVSLTFTDVRLVHGAPAKGPRTTDAQFLAALNLDLPELARVKAAVTSGDLAAAKHELAEHVRRRAAPRWYVAPEMRPTIGSPVVTGRAQAGLGGAFTARVKLEGTDWQHIVLPKIAFHGEGKPAGWDQISGLRLQVDAKAAAAEPALAIYLDDVALAAAGASDRRTVTDFEREPASWSCVERCAEQPHGGAACGKWGLLGLQPRARCEFVPRDWSKVEAVDFWIRTSAPTKLQVTVVVESYLPDTTLADQVLAHKFAMGGFKKVIYDFGPRIDWAANAMSEGESKTVEWNCQLNRHFHFQHLYEAYWATGDQRYAKELADEMAGWIEDCPALLTRSGNSPYHHAWETLNTAVRLEYAWPNSLYHCLHSPAFTDELIVAIMKSMAEQARHLVRWPSTGNWLTAESTGVFTVGSVFPEFKEAADWRRIGVERLYKQLEEEVYPDGIEYELALGYNSWVLSEFLRILEITKLNGTTAADVPADYQARIEKMFGYLMYDAMPNGIAVGLNDSGNEAVRDRLIEGMHYFPARDDFAYVLSNGAVGHAPRQTSVAFPYAGHYVLRGGWDRDARFLHLDAGPFGMGHQHEDKLHFVVYGYGKQLLLDAGNYMYDASRWRRYVLSTRGHNTILVDGEGQARRGQKETNFWPRPWTAAAPAGNDARFVTTRALDYAAGYYREGYGPSADKTVTHARQILFAKPDYWLVLDTLTAGDDKPHACQSLFHIDAAEATADESSKAVTTAEAKSANLAIAAWPDDALNVSIVKGTTEEPVQGWSGVNGPWRAVPTAVYAKSWQGTTQLLYALCPFPAGQAATPPRVSRLPVQQGKATGVRVERPGHGVDLFVIQAEGRVHVAAEGVSTDAEAAMIGSGEGAGVRAVALVNGTRLAAGGASITLSQPGSVSIDTSDAGVRTLRYTGTEPTKCIVRLPGDSERSLHVEPQSTYEWRP